jgi:hypothetical protein
MQREVKSGYLRDPAEQSTNQKLPRTRTVEVGMTAEIGSVRHGYSGNQVVVADTRGRP